MLHSKQMNQLQNPSSSMAGSTSQQNSLTRRSKKSFKNFGLIPKITKAKQVKECSVHKKGRTVIEKGEGSKQGS